MSNEHAWYEPVTIDAAIYHLTLAAACMARGLTPGQADQVQEMIQHTPLARIATAGEAQRVLEEGIAAVGGLAPIKIIPPTIIEGGQPHGRP